MKLVMGYTKRGEQMHLVDGDDLAVGLCGVKIDHHVRQYGHNGALVLYTDHWRDGATGPLSGDRTCFHCKEREAKLRQGRA